MRHPILLAVCAGILAGGLVATAEAQPLHARPGSVLIFPLFNSTESNNTIITVTNTNESEETCGNGFREGDVQVHYIYTDGETCQLSDTDEDLTPADTETVLARGHNPNAEVGYLTVEARDPETNFSIDFDFLIGSATVVNSEFDFEWSYTPYAFETVQFMPTMVDACGRAFVDNDPTDTADFGKLDFNATDEYSAFPDRLLLDNFFGEGDAMTPGGGTVTFGTTLFLMSTDPNTLPTDLNVQMVGYNNNERTFSRNFRVECYLIATLEELTGATTQSALDGDSDDGELFGVETGWFKLDFTDPDEGFLGVVVSTATIGGNLFTAGRELQYTGRRATCLPRF